MIKDYSFLITGAKWSEAELDTLSYSFLTVVPSYYSDPVAAAI